MRYLLVTLMLLVSSSVFATTPDSMSLARSVADLHNALIDKDTVKLKNLLRDDVHYYHSNGWVELKQDVINDLYNGKLTYKQISVQSQNISITGTMGQAKMIVDVEVTMKGKPLQLQLNVFQHWVWKNNGWMLLARKSEKI